MPAANAPWIARLLEMQYGANGLRELKINVLPRPLISSTIPPSDFIANAARLESLLQSMIQKGAEEHRQMAQDPA